MTTIKILKLPEDMNDWKYFVLVVGEKKNVCYSDGDYEGDRWWLYFKLMVAEVGQILCVGSKIVIFCGREGGIHDV